jgi:hypothetical protein
MRFLSPSIEDIRAWGRCFSLYPGATATGSSERNMAPRADGALSAAIPLQGADHAKRLCETSGLAPTTLESDSRQIDEFQVFRLGLTGYKFETSFRGAVKWLTNCNLQCLDEDRVLSVLSAETYLGSSITSSIEEVSLLVDKATVYELLSVPSERVFASAASQFH